MRSQGGTGDCIKFMVSDIGALGPEACFEEVTIDFHNPVEVESVWTRLTGQSGIENASVHASLDDTHYSLVGYIGGIRTNTMEV